ncbi:MAG: hypothetical protein R3F59_32705, partial [Myxococcota bacterium]
MPVWWVLTLLGCIQKVSPGPDLGDCAEIPDGVFGFGEAGIGTCLAGPADLSFFQQDGGTFLAVTNADPFRQFRTGSVLVLDWDALAEELDRDDVPDRLFMDRVPVAGVLEISDDDDGDGEGGNPYLGGFGYLPDHQAAIVTSRLTEGGNLRSGRDEAFVLDLTGLERADGMKLAQTVTLQDDPFPVVVDSATERAYVGNLTDHSVSVLSTRPGVGNPDDIVTVVDVAPDAGAEAEPIVDVDGSGSLATVSTLSVTDPAEIFEDEWTMTYVDGTVRLYVPTAVDDTVDGLVRWSSGDGFGFEPSPIGYERGLGEVREPFSEVDLDTGIPILWFARSDGTILRSRADIDSDGWLWVTDDQPVLAGARFYGSPSVAPLEGAVGLYVDSRDAPGEPAEVLLAESVDNVVFSVDQTVLAPPAGLSY